MTELEEPGWRVRMGAGLLIHAPGLSAERLAAELQEQEREAQAAEDEAQVRRAAAYEQRWMLKRQGVEEHAHADVLGMVSRGQDRGDRIEARKEREGREAQGLPEPRLNRWESEANVKAYAAEREATAASQADLRKVKLATEAELSGVQSTLSALKVAVVDLMCKRP